ncbi:hypothetical protein JOB18_035615 [Solea senegalensis]|uniref:Uncharacterized protein n=1 Tax=Solea senegalensis TaxID=28829 RepID=A0AAV6Q0E5_SOLSE|nr:hypothetical protein JOB18_035615 [Solea senegalensis]
MPGSLSLSLSHRQPAPGHRQHGAPVPAETDTMMMTVMPGAAPLLLPPGIINPSLPIRNIRMKFAVLAGLIQVGEVNNRDIVETVLNLVSGFLLIFSRLPCYYLVLFNGKLNTIEDKDKMNFH